MRPQSPLFPASFAIALILLSPSASALTADLIAPQVFLGETGSAERQSAVQRNDSAIALMQGSRGVYSPGLDPLTALGIEAQSDAERRRYAELQVRAEAQRVQKELAYDQAYRDAWNRLYPNLQPVQAGGQAAPQASPAVRGNGRLAVFVTDSCAACTERVKALQSAGQAFDLYLIGSQNDDARIRRWAVLAGVDPAKVRGRQITLNHDAGRWVQLGLGGELPAVVREVNGQWLRQ